MGTASSCTWRSAAFLLLVLGWSHMAAQTSRRVAPLGANARRLALVIGNNTYPWKPLTNAVNDAQSLAALLPQLGFGSQDITIATNTTLRQLQRVTREFLEKVRLGDVALVYYSGHGVELGGVNYLVPVDFPSNASDLELQDDAYPAQQLLRNLEATQARVRLMAGETRNGPPRLPTVE